MRCACATVLPIIALVEFYASRPAQAGNQDLGNEITLRINMKQSKTPFSAWCSAKKIRPDARSGL
jgi:hypothetical protein